MPKTTDDTILLIPARGGSKGVPRKNVRELGGTPLIAHTIEAALQADLGRVVVSTDDEEIARASRDAGAEVPWMRPAELATDTASSVDVMMHALDALVPSRDATLVLLQPTSPFRTAEDITGAVELHRRQGLPVVGVVRASKPPHWLMKLDERGGLARYLTEEDVTRRQDSPELYYPNGAIYVLDAQEFRRDRRPIPPGALPWVMPAWRSVDIDTELDWTFAEVLANLTPAQRRERFETRNAQ